jgi:hypothetical protein
MMWYIMRLGGEWPHADRQSQREKGFGRERHFDNFQL